MPIFSKERDAALYQDFIKLLLDDKLSLDNYPALSELFIQLVKDKSPVKSEGSK
jgi:hypothetical protein